MKLSTRVQHIQPSATLAAQAQAKQLVQEGKDIISLTVGQPDFTTPKNIQQKAIESIQNGTASFYTPSSGLFEMKQAIQTYIKREYHMEYKENEVLVTTGGKFALYACFQTLVETGDEVLIPAPYWVSYSEQVKLADGKPVLVTAKDQQTGKVTVEDLNRVISSRSKVLLLNSPSNPTGMIYTKEELEKIAVFAKEHQLWVIADDMYSKLVYNGATYTSIVQVSKEMRQQTIVITGVSKTYAMTGWRIGFAFGPKEVIQKMANIQSHATSNPTTVSQYAAIEAVTGTQEYAEQMRQEFEQRLNVAYELVASLPGFSLQKPQGAFYLFPDVTKAMEHCGFSSVDAFCKALLYEAGVAVVSGTGFGVDHAIRLSYACSKEIFKEGIERILAFLQQKSLK